MRLVSFSKTMAVTAALDLSVSAAALSAETQFVRIGTGGVTGVYYPNVVGEGSVYESILNVAKQTEADLIVVQFSRPALQDYLLGPNAARVVRHAKCSVLVVRD